MTVRNTTDQGFDDFRKERKRMRARQMVVGSSTPLGYENKALRELEQVEMREERDQQLTKEVHDFFAHATRQAAGIVEKVARDAQEEAGVRVEQEMEAFLIDALARMNSFVVAALNQRRAPVAEARMEPKLGNLVGDSLDEFRWEGTADIGDKHIGQDPFDTDVEEVRRQFRAEVEAASGIAPAADPVPIEEHLVAKVQSEDAEEAPVETPADEVPGEVETTAGLPTAPRAPAPPAAGAVDVAPRPSVELERFKTALKALVLQGTMSRDEARAAWQTRLRSMQQKG